MGRSSAAKPPYTSSSDFPPTWSHATVVVRRHTKRRAAPAPASTNSVDSASTTMLNTPRGSGSRPPMRKAKLEHNAKNRVMVAKLHSVIESLLAEMLVHGFFGAGTVKVIVQDGTIQHI